MALKPCRECKQPVSSAADKCPHCGKPTPGFNGIGCLPTIVVLVLVVMGVQAIVGDSSSSSRTSSAPAVTPRVQKSPEEMVRAACRVLMRDRLHDPDSVEYLDFDTAQPVTEVAPGIFKTRQRVRAKNAFGAKTLATYECGVGKTDDGFTLLTLEAVK